MRILKVPQNEVEEAWKVAVKLLRKANTHGAEMDEVQVYKDLQEGIRQLWLGEDGCFACLTQILREEEGKPYVLIYMLGGSKLRFWYYDLFLFLYAWARAQRVTHLQIDYPRPGWKRLLASLGFISLDEDTLVKEI